MSLFNTAIHYNVYLDIPDDINFSWNYIYDNTVFDLDNFIQNLNIKNDPKMIKCIKCNLYVPETESYKYNGEFYCCESHAKNNNT